MQVIELLSLCVGVAPKVMCVARESRKHISQRDTRASSLALKWKMHFAQYSEINFVRTLSGTLIPEKYTHTHTHTKLRDSLIAFHC